MWKKHRIYLVAKDFVIATSDPMSMPIGGDAPPIIDVKLDFEFDKSEELYRAIEDAYQEVYDILDVWQGEFKCDPRLSERMYFSEYLSKRQDMCNEMRIQPNTNVNVATFLEWLDNKTGSGEQYNSLDHSLMREVSEEAVKVNLFGKSRQSVNAKRSVSGHIPLAAPSRSHTAPSKLLQRLNKANSVLSFDYDNVFNHFHEDWHEKHPGVQSEGSEPNIMELKRLHMEQMQKAKEEEIAENGLLQSASSAFQGFSTKLANFMQGDPDDEEDDAEEDKDESQEVSE